jgi:hypothetical protein
MTTRNTCDRPPARVTRTWHLRIVAQGEWNISVGLPQPAHEHEKMIEPATQCAALEKELQQTGELHQFDVRAFLLSEACQYRLRNRCAWAHDSRRMSVWLENHDAGIASDVPSRRFYNSRFATRAVRNLDFGLRYSGGGAA